MRSRTDLRRWPQVVLLVVLAGVGAVAGVVMAGTVSTEVGPFHADLELRVRPSGDTTVRLPPLGTLAMDTHDGPFGLVVRVGEIDPEAARGLAEAPAGLRTLRDDVADEVQAATRQLLLRAATGALVGALMVVLLREWSRRAAGVGVVVALFVVASTAGAARASWRPESLAQPRYSGLLSSAPQAVGAVGDIQRRFDAYTDQLVAMVENTVLLYRATSELESFRPGDSTIRVLHVSDLHLNPQAFELIEQLSKQFRIDVVVDTGDIVDWGTELEDRFTTIIGRLGIPYIFVRGNHDSAGTAAAVAAQPNAVVLDRSTTEAKGLRFWGVADPRFTPDKRSGGEDGQDGAVRSLAERLPRTVPDGIDVVLVHDPALASELGGIAPLVLSGHIHRPAERRLKGEERRPKGEGGAVTLHLIEGSTGGAGLRALRGDEPEPLAASVLYFDPDTSILVAFDRIKVGGLGTAGVQIQRRILRAPDEVPDGRGGRP